MARPAKIESSKPKKHADNEDLASIPHLSRTDRLAMGKALRDKCPRNAHAAWKATAQPA